MTTYSPPVGTGPSNAARPAEAVTLLLDPHMDRRVQRVLRHLSARGLRLATAESCTGGLLASMFTDVPGVGHVFDRGFVTYDETSKQELLGVDADLLQARGAVSRPVAIAMAEGARAHSQADVAISTTGYADIGPEPGLVHMAVVRPGGPPLHLEQRYGTIGRAGVRVACLRAAITMLEEIL